MSGKSAILQGPMFLRLSFIVGASVIALTLRAEVPEPEVFSPGVISGPEHEAAPVFSADATTMWFTRVEKDVPTIMESRQGFVEWSKPFVASFSGRWKDQEPALSPDGRYMIFVSNRPVEEGGAPLDGLFMGRKWIGGGGNLWRIDRSSTGWTEPRRLPDVINSGSSIFAPSVAADGTLYFMKATEDGKHFRIYASQRNAAGDYASPELLPFSDDRYTDVDPVVSADQKFMVFGSNRPPAAGIDLFIVFRQEGRWGVPRHLGTVINSPGSDAEPRLSPDEKTLYFSSDRRKPKLIADWNNGNYNIWRVPMEPLLQAFAQTPTSDSQSGRAASAPR
ncbi:hypothetical protein ACS5PN_26880 [Roseateles sp. NT4]|uniref:hypothetical protein n=1 Tax=Roseateles sp. NT4 TaxID=3453715 RepID=UPI003EEA1842